MDSKMTGPLDPSQIPIAWCRLDASGRLLELNAMFLSLFEADAGRLRDRTFQEACCTNESAFNKLLQNFPNCNAVSFRMWLKRGEDSKFPAVLHAKSVASGSGSPEVSLVVLDDSFNHVAREKAKFENETSRQKEQLKNEFIAIASHELRTPIQPILGFALLAKRGKIAQEQAWDGVLKEARRLQQLANDILDVSRIESNQISYKMDHVRINDLIQNILDSARTDLKKDISLELAAERNEQEILADKSRITQVITNLVNNSIKFTPKGSVKITSRLQSAVGPLEIRVTDTGPGIPLDMLPRLFTKFATKDHGDAVSNAGTGLGLFICRSIITAHKGTIEARNVPEGGAEFVIILPLMQD